jgi:hypothetical protein
MPNIAITKATARFTLFLPDFLSQGSDSKPAYHSTVTGAAQTMGVKPLTTRWDDVEAAPRALADPG